MSTSPDPRPQVVTGDDGQRRVRGSRCVSCGHRMLVTPPRCARCFGAVEVATFGPSGTVWSSTVVRIAVPGRTPPYALAYVDVDDGPRVLAQVAGATERVAVGARVTLSAPTEFGDLLVETLG